MNTLSLSSKIVACVFGAALASLISLGSAFAGGGEYRPLNFSWGQQISGKSFSPEIEVNDNNGKVIGETFVFEAQGGLAGASCSTTQGTSDGSGKIKANCKADAYGKFVFTVRPISNPSRNSTVNIDVYFTEPGQGSGSGFPETGSPGVYQVVVSPNGTTVTQNETFTLEAKLKRPDGSFLSDQEYVQEVQSFRWTVLQGSIVTSPSQPSSHGNRVLRYFSPDTGKTVMKVTAVLNNGQTIDSGAFTITTNAKTQPSPSPTTKPKTSATPTPKATTSPKPTASIKPSGSPAASDSTDVSVEVSTLESSPSPTPEPTPAEPEKKPNIIVRAWRGVKGFFSRIF
jgi:hypothetical protein